MLGPSAAHATAIAPSMTTMTLYIPPTAVPCASCRSTIEAHGAVVDCFTRRKSTRAMDASRSQVHPTSFLGAYHSSLFIAAARRWRKYPFVAAASLNEESYHDQDNEADDSRAYRPPRRKAGQSRRAPWEDIQWTNVPQEQRYGRYGDNEDVDKDERVSGSDYNRYSGRQGYGSSQGKERKFLGSTSGRQRSRPYGDRAPRPYPKGPIATQELGDDEYDTDYPRDRRPPQGRDQRPSPWNPEWFDDARRVDQGGPFPLMKSFYDSLFWYGAVYRGGGELPAMNFKDLMEPFNTGNGWWTLAWRDPRAPHEPIVPPEELAAEQDFRWRPARRDVERGEDRPGPRERVSMEGARRGRGTPGAESGGNRRASRGRSERRAFDDDIGDYGDDYGGDYDDGREAFRARRRRGSRNDQEAAAIERLRRRQRQLADREHAIEMDLDKVRERLSVVDATVELWMRRSSSMKARGGTDTDTEVVQAKRRIYGLKEEGRRLDSARAELEARLEDSRRRLDRVLQELEDLGEDPEPYSFYQSDKEFPFGSDDAVGVSTDEPVMAGERGEERTGDGVDEGADQDRVSDVMVSDPAKDLGLGGDGRGLEPFAVMEKVKVD